MSLRIALLDKSGLITATNPAWRETSLPPFQGERFQQGSDFFADCQVLGETATAIGDLVVEAAREVITGQRQEFRQEFACDTREGQRWFELYLRHLDGEGDAALIVQEETTRRRLEMGYLETEWPAPPPASHASTLLEAPAVAF